MTIEADGDPVQPPQRPGRRRTVITAIIGLVVMVAIFAFLFPELANYQQAFSKVAELPPAWIAILLATGAVNVLVYPITAIAAIPRLGYRAAFVNRQAGFLVSNVIPGGGAFAVGTQYAILGRYGVSSSLAAAAVSADAVWTYLLTLGFPAVAVALLVVEGRSTAAYTTTAAIGLAIVITSVVVISTILRSEDGAHRVARMLQRPVTAVLSRFHRPAPDLDAKLLEFHHHASVMVATRWRQLTVTNLAAQGAPLLVLWAALAGLGAYPQPLTLIEIFAAYSIALLLTSFPVTPGGLGTVDAALVGLLVAFGADSSIAIAADLIWRLVWFLPQLLVGLTAFGIYWWDQRKDARVRARATQGTLSRSAESAGGHG
ncbi:MAG: YbhN family protein [Actinomycetales bacterium]|nr:YbhN family protein [Actinomycetales bacterium]